MDRLRNKHIAILGLGTHGGGASATRFAYYKQAASITIIDKQFPQRQQDMLKPLSDLAHNLLIGTHSDEAIQKFDIVIKNPAIPRQHSIIKNIPQVETDISLFFQYTNIPAWGITGTKGKSSISTALHNLLSLSNIHSALAGNITVSPLTLLLEQKQPQRIVLELSSFQLGDLTLVNQDTLQSSFFQNLDIMILTNVLLDHQNYYSSLAEYTQDKLFPFLHLKPSAQAIIPYSPHTITLKNNSITLTLHNNTLQLSSSQVLLHNTEPLPTEYRGAWVDAQGLWIRHTPHTHAALHTPSSLLPAYIPPQNIAIIACVYLAHHTHSNIALPHNYDTWNTIFKVPHRKELVATIQGRTFINDSAATIPQAIQLQSFQNNTTHLIAGGTDKNLNPQDFLAACSPATHIYLLEGSYTEKIIPLLDQDAILYHGPFNSLDKACQAAFEQSNPKDIIILSPGCASFGMFRHEFDRGNTFKDWVHTLQS